jgi:ABC-type proline/glycine betaine transport system permease subunit
MLNERRSRLASSSGARISARDVAIDPRGPMARNSRLPVPTSPQRIWRPAFTARAQTPARRKNPISAGSEPIRTRRGTVGSVRRRWNCRTEWSSSAHHKHPRRKPQNCGLSRQTPRLDFALAGYWIHPVLRFIGPLPATAWLPLAFFVFPSSFSASIFLIALATGFPVTVLTWSGVAGVNSAYYDIARTLGATQRFLVLKVAIPAAMPHVFVGLFMGLSNSFAVLVVAEMLGVKAGLGWYLQWAQGWAAYANMYAALLLMAFLCSGLITLLFRLRDRLLSWQKGLVRW